VLERKVAAYTAAGARVSVIHEPFTVVILTPIMQRAHQTSSAGDIAFVDSTASCDANNHVITFVMVTSPYGAVPAGVVITSGKLGRSTQQALQNSTAYFIMKALVDKGIRMSSSLMTQLQNVLPWMLCGRHLYRDSATSTSCRPSGVGYGTPNMQC